MSSENDKATDRQLEEEISILEVLHLIWVQKRYFFYSVSVFFLIGILSTITTPVEYTAEARILPEDSGSGQNNSIGGLSSLIGITGLSIQSGSQGVVLSPEMYPEIVSSEPFLLDLMKERFYFQEKGMEMTLYEYFKEGRPRNFLLSIWGSLKSIPKWFLAIIEPETSWELSNEEIDVENNSIADTLSRRIVHLITETEMSIMSELQSRLIIDAEEKIITLSVKMPEPLISAELNNIVLDKIIAYVIAYKTDKQRENLAFIAERHEEAEANFKEAQLRLAAFRDTNRGMTSEVAKAREEQLQAEFDLTFDIYTSMAQQLEKAKIQLKEDTPVFSDFEPVKIPLSKAEPNIPKILIVHIAVGVLLGGLIITFILGKAYIKNELSERGIISEKVKTS